MERPAIVRIDEGRWRLYVCCATPAPSKHWWIDVLEADDPAGFGTAETRTVFPGDIWVPSRVSTRSRSCGRLCASRRP